MYYGKMTEELDALYDQYYELFEVFPDFPEELEYDDSEEGYRDYVEDIKRALKEKKILPDLHPEPWEMEEV